MLTRSTLLTTLAAGLVLAIASNGAFAQAREEGRLLMASQVLEELRATRDGAIPDRLLERAYGILVIPDLTKLAFFVGGRRGHGVMTIRDKDGRFTNPVFVTLTGGSFGWQWGVQSTDIVLVFTSRKGIEGITGGKVTLGADASVAAGPVGRDTSAATDSAFKAEVYSYSRTRGVFAGLALDGSVITVDDKADSSFYRKPDVAASDILAGSITTNDEPATRFLKAVSVSANAEPTTNVASSAPTAPPPPASDAPETPSPLHSQSGTQSFPMEDSKPGSEPH